MQRTETVNQIMSEQPEQQSLGLGESEPALGWVATFSLRHQVSLYVNSSWVAVAGSHRELLEYLQPGEAGLPKLKQRPVHACSSFSFNCCIKYDQQALWGCKVCVPHPAMHTLRINITDRWGWVIKLSGDH